MDTAKASHTLLISCGDSIRQAHECLSCPDLKQYKIAIKQGWYYHHSLMLPQNNKYKEILTRGDTTPAIDSASANIQELRLHH